MASRAEPALEELGEAELRSLVRELARENEALRQTREALGAAYDRYGDLYRRAPVAYLTVDADGAIREANRAACHLIGVERSALIGEHLAAFVASEDREKLDLHRQQLFADGNRSICELRLASGGAGPRDVRLESVAYPTADAGGRVCRTVLSDLGDREPAARPLDSARAESGLNDMPRKRKLRGEIEDRKRVEDVLAETASRAATVLNAIVEGVLMIDANGIVLTVNPAVEEMFGYSRDELVGKNVNILMPAAHREKHDDHLAHYGASGERTTLAACRDVVGQRKDGSTFPLELAIGAICDDSEAQYVGILRDRSERRQMEEALRQQRDFAESLIDTAHAIVLVLDTDGRIVRFNSYLEQLSGWTQREVEGKDWFSTFIPGHEAERIRALFGSALTGSRVSGNVNAIKTRDGSERIVEWYDSPLCDGSGQMTGLLCIGHDITERVEAEAALRRMSHRIQEAERLASISTLVAGIAHEVGTPMNVILGYAQMMRASLPDEKNRERADLIVEQVTRLIDLIQTLLNIARPSKPVRAPVELEVVVEHALMFFSDKLRQRGVKAKCEAKPVPRILGDADRLQQVFLNLFSNAIDAMPDGGRLEIGICPAGDGELEICVEDSGAGIAPAALPHIFEPFYSTKPRSHGSGLGLMVSKSIIVDHGGSIEVESECGSGTRFRILLPADAGPR